MRKDNQQQTQPNGIYRILTEHCLSTADAQFTLSRTVISARIAQGLVGGANTTSPHAYWGAPRQAANAISVAQERLMDALNIAPVGSLHARLSEFANGIPVQRPITCSQRSGSATSAAMTALPAITPFATFSK